MLVVITFPCPWSLFPAFLVHLKYVQVKGYLKVKTNLLETVYSLESGNEAFEKRNAYENYANESNISLIESWAEIKTARKHIYNPCNKFPDNSLMTNDE